MAFLQPPTKIVISLRMQPSFLRGEIIEGITRSYRIPQLYNLMGPRAKELIIIVGGGEG